ncbi:TrkH family potassium uptake protein [Lewinella sp. IMCC34183]|uniref:TrkH family potassium uptake protein n=1 Tax=Lewinella sp. IMCC34183 TaxID=2248762 RepID=UPI000E280E7D|nr:potassium transporter TrkG [Lewinella sp. IMCC34183]
MKATLTWIHPLALWASVVGIFAFLTESGFAHPDATQRIIDGYYFFVLTAGVASLGVRYFHNFERLERKVFVFDLLTVLFTLFAVVTFFVAQSAPESYPLLARSIWIHTAVALVFVREISEVNLNYRRTFLNPAQLFVVSFVSVILLGALLLMLPRATAGQGLTFVDALFTATSAVCVTGLIVVDTGSYFTSFGQSIILTLIQVGGLGILTFASYFSYFFKGGSTYENQLVLSDLTNSNKIGEVFLVLKYVILITFGVELLAGLLIYFTLDAGSYPTVGDRVFFAAFHSISAFCNAGFSTLGSGLYEPEFRYNYTLQLIIIVTFVLGGLGFPIVSNVINYLRYLLRNLLHPRRRAATHAPWVLNLNSRVTLVTTFTISAVAFVLFYVLEYNNTLAEHDGVGKVVTALFGATTPRTAGFNTIDNAAMLFPTTMMVFLLMWIGASPASTGGGIKTSTFAIAILNVVSLARGEERIEVFRREISNLSVRRSFAVMALSLLVIGLAVMAITFFDGGTDLRSIAFECFSAYSTVGLSLGITGGLSIGSKMVLIAVMFFGRVGMLTILVSVYRKSSMQSYRYPTEELTIN